MTSKILAVLAILFVLVGIFIACSKTLTSSSPTTPDILDEPVDQNEWDTTAREPNHYLWSYNLITFDPDLEEFEVIPVRQTGNHWNVLKFLENGPCTSCVSINSFTTNGAGNKEIVVEITHPFNNPSLTGFDVRGVAMFASGHTFSYTGQTVGSGASGELVNAEGYTALYSMGTQGSGPGGLQGYLDGKFSSATIPNATINGYKRHVSPVPGNVRNAFYAGESVANMYEIKMPTGPFVFGYAVDASWEPATTKPVNDPMADFPIEANSIEAWNVNIIQTPVGPGITESGGKVNLEIDVFDWQGLGTVKAPWIDCSELTNNVVTASLIGDFGDFSKWGAEIENVKLASPGVYKALIGVEDVETTAQPSWLDINAYQVIEITVDPSGPSTDQYWARTFGGTGEETVTSIAIDSNSNVYACGGFGGVADFDPGPGVDNQDAGSPAYFNAFLVKYDKFGNYQWVKTWGGTAMDMASDVYIDGSDNIYVSGVFYSTVDFDPGPGQHTVSSAGGGDGFILKLNNAGDFDWVVTLGGSGNDSAACVDGDQNGSILASGGFQNSADFDPSTGTDIHTSQGLSDGFIAKYDEVAGTLVKTYVLGGTNLDVVADFYCHGTDTYMAGFFSTVCDFDPTSGLQLKTSNGYEDCFAGKLDQNLNPVWIQSWGGPGSDYVKTIARGIYGDLFIAGTFEQSVDFDPGASTDNHTSNGSEDAYITQFYVGGGYYDSVVFGGTGDEEIKDMFVHFGQNLIFVSGQFDSTCDFDPGQGITNIAPIGSSDAFISQFNVFLDYGVTVTFGSSVWESIWALNFDHTSGDVFYGGNFGNTIDFDPSAGVDNHTATASPDMVLGNMSKDLSW